MCAVAVLRGGAGACLLEAGGSPAQVLFFLPAVYVSVCINVVSYCPDLISCHVDSVLCLAGGFCLLVASNALGPINLVYDPSSPTLFTVQMLRTPDDDASSGGAGGGVFFVLSALLCACAFSGLMPLKSALQRLLFLATFSYCGARALEQW